MEAYTTYAKGLNLNSFFPQWAQDLNTTLSFIGFFITLAVMFQVRQIKKSFLNKARIPDIIKELTKVTSDLSKTLYEWPSQKQQAHLHIKIAISLLMSTTPLLEKNGRQEVNRINSKLSSASANFGGVSVNVAWDLYTDLQSVLTSIKQHSKNVNWE